MSLIVEDDKTKHTVSVAVTGVGDATAQAAQLVIAVVGQMKDDVLHSDTGPLSLAQVRAAAHKKIKSTYAFMTKTV